MTKAEQEISDKTYQTKVLKFIQSIVANKFLEFSKNKIEVMLKISDETKQIGYYKSILK